MTNNELANAIVADQSAMRAANLLMELGRQAALGDAHWRLAVARVHGVRAVILADQYRGAHQQ